LHAKRILLVDDNPHDVELALAAFEQGDLRDAVAVAHSGEEALDYLRAQGRFAGRPSGHPTVVLLDLKMPHMDGVAVLQAIKDDPELSAIPIVMLSTSREDSDIEVCYRRGASAYVVKPVDFGQFIEAVKTIGVFWALLNEHRLGM
jgi:CheY-like chemotaxis protein